MKVMLRLFTGVCLAALAGQAFAAVIGGSNYVAELYYMHPNSQETFVAFDWDGDSNLYYSTGRPDWGIGFSVHRYARGSVETLYADENAFAGSGRVTAIGGRIYFNDGGTYERWTYDYFRYDPAQAEAPVNLAVLSDLYGLETRDGTDFWAAGGYDAAIYYSGLDSSGYLESNPLVNLGTIGNASGPLVFDAEGNLYYAEGYVYSGHPKVYRWSAAEVAAAIADPAAAPLSPTDHEWATLSAGEGASGMAMDDKGNLLVTATSFAEPSQLHRLFAANGICAGFEVMARSDSRMEMVRVHDGRIYVSTAEGLFKVYYKQSGRQPANDYDGDGKSDLAVYDNNNGTWFAYSLQSNQATVWGAAWGWPGAVTVPGDYDGDAIGDLCVFDQNTGCWFAWSPAQQSAVLWADPWGWTGVETAGGDYDGDGKSDMGVYDQATGNWYVRTAAGAILAWQKSWGWPGAVTVPGDYDGDGKSDIAVYDQNTGYWYIQTLADTILAWQQPWGWPGATTIPGDYDGDGKHDLCVYDQPTGAWYVWSLANNKAVVWNKAWGWTGAVPVPGDYDGDGRDDLAVYDTTTGHWYIWSVEANAVLAWQQPWGWPGAYPPGGR